VLLTYLLISFFLCLSYIIIIVVYRQGWDSLKKSPAPSINFQPQTTISVLIAARNEAANIGACLDTILSQQYPKALFEIIVIDDFSEDKTYEIALLKGINVIRLADYCEKGSKKKAIEVGIAKAKGTLIVATDADCHTPPLWLRNIAYFYETQNCKFIAAPVNFHQEKNYFEKAQSLDFLGLMLITGAGIHKGFMHMCNGANLAYERAVFYDVDGFKGIDKLASGDDMLLMQKVALKYPGSLGFLKNEQATVLTHAKPTWESFISQRVRWASKTNSYKEVLVTAILALVFFFCNNIILSACLIPFLGKVAFALLLLQLSLKGIMDYYLLYPIATFFKRKDLLRSFIPAFFGHIVYIIIVGTLANLVFNYEWKGRRVR
jgi:cellulose synthase/poly-beta-1,6-N-acetylglucosamine synthase-like glycosyltransferase